MNPGTPDKIKVLVIEDSPIIQNFLIHILNSDPRISVVGTADDGGKAIEAINKLKPDIATMDIHMPIMDGFQATRKIMETQPLPIIIVSGTTSISEVGTIFRAMEAGAVAAVPRPAGFGHPEHDSSAKELLMTIKSMSEVKVVKRWPKAKRAAVTPSIHNGIIKKTPAEIKIIGIGASTGGPPVLKTILSGLSKDFPVPILIVQHIASGFTSGLVDWLSQSSGFPVHVAGNMVNLIPGHAYVAPEKFHIGITSTNQIFFSNDNPENGSRPSISFLFRSIANIYCQNSIGILLTGMGRDGAEELKLMKDNGAITIAQDAESSVVYGMPKEAIILDGATYVLSPDEIAPMLVSLVKKE
jgi:two-component system, chemotaxis family, protein-glutamate methylesterase/glutaminase